MLSSLILGLVLANPASAANCDYLVKKADSAQGAALAKAFGDLAKCDAKLAEENYTKFMSSAKDADTLVALSQAALMKDVWNPVWQQLGKITDYDARDEVARRVGEMCVDEPKVVSFLQGAYFGLRDIEFQQWDDAFIACESEELTAWLTKQIENPPKKQFDDKFNALMDAFIKKKGVDALPSLATAAQMAAGSGPYDSILMQMDAAVAPSLGDEMTPANQKALETALVEVAHGVDSARAKAVADRLANAGSHAAAAALLPDVYPQRQQGDGSWLYGAAAVEAAECKGTKTAVIHAAEVKEAGKRWVILEDVQAPLRATKAKLSKCTPEGDAWFVATTPEPVGSSKEADEWFDSLEARWVEKGYDVKVQSEKTISLD